MKNFIYLFWIGIFCVDFTSCKGENLINDEILKFSLDDPKVIVSNRFNSTVYDDLYIGYSTIIQLSDSLYYLYYECKGTQSNGNLHIAFAFSNDGFNWIKSFPTPIKHEVNDDNGKVIEGANIIFYKDLREFDVVRVNDLEYPYRLIANEKVNHDKMKNDTQMCMWKSKDGINFEGKKVILKGKYDSQPSIITKGDKLKVYIRVRGRDDVRRRHIGVVFFDLDGNQLSPITKLSNDLYYTSSASFFSDTKEILFPTYFDQRYPHKNHYEAILVENNRIIKLPIEFDKLIKEHDKWGMISPHWININGEFYILYHQSNFDHEEITDENVKISELRLSRVIFYQDWEACPPDR